MKKIVTSLLLIFSCVLSEAQTYPGNCNPIGSMDITYRNDACRLAIKRMHEIGSPFADSITIPEVFIDSITKALYAVHSVQNSLTADTVRGIFGHTDFIAGSDSTHIISASNNLADAFGLKKVWVTVYNNNPWGAQWFSGNYAATVNDTVNYLLDRYQLQVERNPTQIYPDRTRYIVSSPIAINAAALARKFEQLSGVGAGNANAVSPMPSGNGNVIRAIYLNNAINISYSFGCGDCPSGCTMGRTWRFLVRTGTDCSVDFLAVENWGHPFLWQMNPCMEYASPTPLCPSGSVTLYSNWNGNNVYQWQVSINGGTYTNIADNANYSGSNTPTLQLNNIPSSWYGNSYTCLSNGVKSKLNFSISFANSWAGPNNGAWENPANWSCGTLPDSNTDVLISSGTVTLNTDVTVRTLTVSAGATLTIAPGVNLMVLH